MFAKTFLCDIIKYIIKGRKEVISTMFRKTMPKNLAMVVGLVVVLGGVFVLASAQSGSTYSVVSTVGGQVFVGRLSHTPFSRFVKLSDAFIYQTVQGADQKVTSQLVDLSVDSYWQPKTVYFNIDNIILEGAVSATSPIAEQITKYKAQQKAAPAPAPTESPAK